MKKIIHIIGNLERGGAEIALLKLIQGSKGLNTHHEVVALKKKGVLLDAFEKENIRVISFKKALLTGKFLKGDILQGWLYHGSFVAYIMAKIFRKKCIFTLHNFLLAEDSLKRLTWYIIMVLKRWSTKVDCVVYCAQSQRREHVKLGFSKEKNCVIENGYNSQDFFEIKNGEPRVYNAADGKIVLGSVGRFDCHKDYPNLLKALKKVKRHNSNFVCILIGQNLDHNNKALKSVIARYHLEEQMILVGAQTQVNLWLNCLDIFVLPSQGEAFSNVLCEAMLARRYCIATDVGDSKLILNGHGRVVKRKNSKRLSKAILEGMALSEEARKKIGASARKHIKKNYSIERNIEAYNALYKEILCAELMD